MKRRVRKQDEIFGMSFLDVVACGFGAMVAILMLAKNAPDAPELVKPLPKSFKTDVGDAADIRQLKGLLAEQSSRNAGLVQREQALKEQLASSVQALNKASSEAVSAPPEPSSKGTMMSSYDGGIPVDATHVVFVVDSSGSMRSNWREVTSKVEQLLAAHPKVEAMQVLSDMGDTLIPGYDKRWIPDTPSARKNFNQSLAKMSAFSNSSPVEGIERALRIYAPKAKKLAIYVLGDDFTGGDFEGALARIDKLNTKGGKSIARIHAVGFSSGHGDRFATLMREVANRHNGVYLGI